MILGASTVDACCVKDANAKAAGEAGRGCATGVVEVTTSQFRSSEPSRLPVAVIGAGPVGRAAAARLIERGIEPIVLERAASVGANLLDYGHVRLFSPWRYNIDPAITAQLEATGWQAPPLDQVPLAGEIVERVLRPFAALPSTVRALRLNTQVVLS